MIRVVLDTNQLVSALLNPEGIAFEILKASGLKGEQKYELVISGEILSEFRRVLLYPRIQKLHGWDEEKIDIFITLIKEIAHIDESRSRERIVPEDPDDDKFFHLAIKSDAGYIISRDMHLLKIKEFKEIRVLRPEVFLSAVRKGAV
ncbi:MAG: putative toxin-antitoxin system toxin component, PIN family [Thermodesulfovibrionales bacterium]|nr:putative toxin-antitoxin system toxin component, PIN family [Nitrospinota bacterium]MCG2709009.1 putative toxin-antitoxin system toxin component, PIN family [Thermodesulfovibrionales bacterium]MCG2813820.1 putative toxin-antitoxin system toxin component, PIN family [Thermodesulfovibrionales bacterium]